MRWSAHLTGDEMRLGGLLVYAGVLAQSTQPAATSWEGVLLQYGVLGAFVLWFILFERPRQLKKEEERLKADADERKSERGIWEGTIGKLVEEFKACRVTFEQTLTSFRHDKRDELNAASEKLEEAREKLEDCLQRKTQP